MIMRYGKVIRNDELNIAEMQMRSPSNPVPGSEWPDYDVIGDQTKLANPPIYFDGVRLSLTLERIASEAQGRAWRLNTALANVRKAKTEAEMKYATETLQMAYDNLAPSVKVEMLIDDLVKQIDHVAPPNPRGYVPHMGIRHAMKPLRDTIAKLKGLFRHDGTG